MAIFNNKNLRKKNQEELIILAQQNNLDALEELIKRNQDNVYTSFYYLSNECQDILDLTQEALFKMAKNIKRLKDISKFKPWLNQIVTRIFYDYLRRKNKKIQTIPINKKDKEEDKFCISDVACNKCTPEEKSINTELNCLIEKSIHKLPNAFKLAIILRELEGLSYEEIAKITNTNVGTVKSRISRARTKLQSDLKQYIA